MDQQCSVLWLNRDYVQYRCARTYLMLAELVNLKGRLALKPENGLKPPLGRQDRQRPCCYRVLGLFLNESSAVAVEIF